MRRFPDWQERMIQQMNSLLGAVTSVAWLGLAAYLLVYLRKELQTILKNFANAEKGKLAVSAQGASIEWERSVVATAVNLTAAAITKPGGERDLTKIVNSVTAAAQTASGAAAGKSVLWVDDLPANNTYGVKALEAQHINVFISASTKDALDQVKAHDFAAIITDQRRVEGGVEDKEAGDHLVKALLQMGVTTPVILSTAWPDKQAARARGFFDATNSQHGVFEAVMRAIRERSAAPIH